MNISKTMLSLNKHNKDDKFSYNSLSSVYNDNTKNIPIADTGATDTFIRQSDATTHTNDTTIQVKLPNGNSIQSQGNGKINTPAPLSPISTHIFNDKDLGRSLISIADYCNQGCTAVFTDKKLTIKHNNKIVATGYKEKNEKLWNLPLPHQTPSNAAAINNVITHTHNADYVAFWHATLGSPTIKTLLNAVRKNYLKMIPKLTTSIISANIPNIAATAKGHLHMNRQGIRSTKLYPSTAEEEDNDLQMEQSYAYAVDYNDNMLTQVIDISPTIHTDLTGKFPVTSHKGNNYVQVSEYNGYIHMVPQATKSASDHLKALKLTLEFFKASGNIPTIQRMDNETSAIVNEYLQKEVHMKIELVPPNNHRTLHAERAIQTAKII